MSPELEAALERCKDYVMTPKERFEQRVSFVYGMLPFGDKRTKADIRKSLSNMYGMELN